MDVIKRIDNLIKEREWSDYKLAAESGLSSSTNVSQLKSDKKKMEYL